MPVALDEEPDPPVPVALLLVAVDVLVDVLAEEDASVEVEVDMSVPVDVPVAVLVEPPPGMHSGFWLVPGGQQMSALPPRSFDCLQMSPVLQSSLPFR